MTLRGVALLGFVVCRCRRRGLAVVIAFSCLGTVVHAAAGRRDDGSRPGTRRVGVPSVMPREPPLVITEEPVGPPPLAAAFTRGLLERPFAQRGDCVRAVALLLVGSLWRPDYRYCRGLTEDRLGLPLDEPTDRHELASRGYAALLFARALRIRGGLFHRLYPWSERYAYREMEARGLMPEGGSIAPISGPELADLLRVSEERLTPRRRRR